MTPLGLTVMRRTATLLHAVPGLSARLVHDGRVLLEVTRPAHPGAAPSGRWLTPCAFRVAVGRAVDAVREGKALAVLGLEAGVDPAVELGAPRGTLLAGGIVHLPTVTGGELAFATTAGTHLVDAMIRAEGRPPHQLDIHCHTDAITASTLVVHNAAGATGTDEFAAALEQVQSLLARTAVRELTDDRDAFLHTTPSHPAASAKQARTNEEICAVRELTLRQFEGQRESRPDTGSSDLD